MLGAARLEIRKTSLSLFRRRSNSIHARIKIFSTQYTALSFPLRVESVLMACKFKAHTQRCEMDAITVKNLLETMNWIEIFNDRYTSQSRCSDRVNIFTIICMLQRNSCWLKLSSSAWNRWRDGENEMRWGGIVWHRHSASSWTLKANNVSLLLEVSSPWRGSWHVVY